MAEPTGKSAQPARGAKAVLAPAMRPSFVGARVVGSYVPRLTRKAFEKFGFSTATLVTDWSAIVGADVARYTTPERLRWPKGVDVLDEAGETSMRGRPGATLIVRVGEGRALDVQYKARQIVERINVYFGYRAVVELRIVQAALESDPRMRRSEAPKPRDVLPPHPNKPMPALEAVGDPALKSALERMRVGIANRRPPSAR